MSLTIFNEIESFLKKVETINANLLGRTATKEEIIFFKNNFKNFVPSWYEKLLITYPLIDMVIGWQQYPKDDYYDGISYIQILSPPDMFSECTEVYPGFSIFKKGFVCIGADTSGGGDPYFIKFDSNNPPLYQIYHDVGVEADDILAQGKNLVSEKFSDFFKNGII